MAKRLDTLRIGFLASILLLANIAETPAQSGQTALVPIDLQVAASRSSFLGINETDAKAAFRVFATRMGVKRGYRVTAHIRVFDDLIDLKAEIERGAIDFIIIDSWDYLTISPGNAMPVEFVTVEQGVVLEDYLILARSDHQIAALSDLKARHVKVLDSTNANTGRHWLQTELLGLGIIDPLTFFGSYDIRSKVSQVILPVFFGQADACVVDRSGLEIMTEMNPQVGRMLTVVQKSEPFLDTVACIRRGGWEADHYRDDLISGLEELTDDPAGQQIMTMFKFDRLVRFESQHLLSVRSLHDRYQNLYKDLADQKILPAEKADTK